MSVRPLPVEESVSKAVHRETTRYLLEDPRFAAAMSLLVMGLGQLFNQQYKRAAVFFAGEVAGIVYLADYALGWVVSETLEGWTSPLIYGMFIGLIGLGWASLWIYNVLDAYRMAEFARFIHDRAFPMLDEDESEILARHLKITPRGLAYRRGISLKALFFGGAIALYSVILVGLGAFLAGRGFLADEPNAAGAGHGSGGGGATGAAQGGLPAMFPATKNKGTLRGPSGLLARAEARMSREDLVGAEADYKRALAVTKDPAEVYRAYLGLARVYGARGDMERSNAVIRSALLVQGLGGTSGVSVSQRGGEDSRRDLPANLKEEEREVLARSREHIERGEPAAALAALDGLLSRESPPAMALLLAGEAHLARSEWAAARTRLARYVDLEGSNQGGFLALARAEAGLGLTAEALVHLSRHLADHPGDAKAHVLAAAIKETDQGPEAALASVEEGLIGNPTSPLLLAQAVRLAHATDKQEQAYQAGLALLRVPKLPAASGEALRITGELALEREDHDTALRAGQALLENAPKSAVGFLLVGRALEAQGKTAEARSTYRKGLQAVPDNEELRKRAAGEAFTKSTLETKTADRSSKGEADAETGEPASASSTPSPEPAVDEQPIKNETAEKVPEPPRPEEKQPWKPRTKNPAAETSRATQEAEPTAEVVPDAAYIMTDSPAGSTKTGASTLSRALSDLDAYVGPLREAELAYHAKEYEKAKGLYRKVLAVRADHAHSLMRLGWILKREGKLDAAADYLRRARKSRPDDPRILSELGQVYLDQGKNVEAQEAFEATVEIDPANLASRYALAVIHESAGDLPEAEAQYRRILEHYPELLEVHEYLGNVCFRQRKYTHALQEFEILAEASPGDTAVRFKRAVVLFELGHTERSRTEFERLARELPEDSQLAERVESYLARL